MIKSLYEIKNECCGCEACANACPQKIIIMQEDSEGFVYPHLMYPEKCIGCNKCEKVCPIKNVCEVPDFSEKSYAGYSNEQNEIKKSASGSLGTAIAKGIIKQGGVVYGVKYTEDCSEVEYERSTSTTELESFRTSKYAQARKRDVYKQILKDLEAGMDVLFIGLPCDVYAVKLFLGKKYNNFFTCALICHGTTSILVHKQYVQKLVNEEKSDIEKFSVRYKKEGWKPYYIRAVFKNGKEWLEKFSDSTYGIAFLYLKRPSCNTCKIKRAKNHADITIGDYHLASGGKFKPYNSDGVSSVVVHNQKGDYLLSIAENCLIEEVPIKNVLYSEAYYKAIPKRWNRKEFGKVLSTKGLESACALKSVKVIDRQLARKAWFRKQGAKVKKMILGKK